MRIAPRIARTITLTSVPVRRLLSCRTRTSAAVWISDTRAPPDNDDRGRDQQQQREGEQRLPGERENLVHADADKAPAHPRDDQEHDHRLREEPDRPEP